MRASVELAGGEELEGAGEVVGVGHWRSVQMQVGWQLLKWDLSRNLSF